MQSKIQKKRGVQEEKQKELQNETKKNCTNQRAGNGKSICELSDSTNPNQNRQITDKQCFPKFALSLRVLVCIGKIKSNKQSKKQYRLC